MEGQTSVHGRKGNVGQKCSYGTTDLPLDGISNTKMAPAADR
jgi:hypothetical protein